ncbi:MAG: hypothetical protein K5669_10110 [Lachnospiraceae bacterium]|nr:hypothetical protein [Lachnospiraceae bacterium]
MGTNSALARSALVMGFISLGLGVSAIFSTFAIPLGAISLILALLSARKGKQLPKKAMTAVIASVAGIALGIIITLSAFVSLFKSGKLMEVINESQSIVEQVYGEDYQVNAYDGNWL